jgi:hypothetical protein
VWLDLRLLPRWANAEKDQLAHQGKKRRGEIVGIETFHTTFENGEVGPLHVDLHLTFPQ